MRKMLRFLLIFTVLVGAILLTGNIIKTSNAASDETLKDEKTDLPTNSGAGPEKIHLNLNVNEEYLALVSNQSEGMAEGNQEKFGKDINKSSINVHFTDFKSILTQENREDFEVSTKGVIKSPNGNFNFTGQGFVYKVKLSNGEWIYSGSFEGSFKNKVKDETFTISMRHNSETKESDVVFVSGVIGDSGVLPFGKPFLFEDELAEIEDIIRQVDEAGGES